MAKAVIAAYSFLVLLLAFPTVFGTDHDVGDTSGWVQGFDYNTWASGKTFKVGDNLVFKYDSTHAVDEVDESGYNNCDSSNLIKNYKDGNSKVPLTTTGKKYFICPTTGHCSGGMKLQINVEAATTTTTPPPSGTTPSNPSPPSESGTPASANTTTSPPPKPNGAVPVPSGIALLLASFFTSPLIMLAFMG